MVLLFSRAQRREFARFLFGANPNTAPETEPGGHVHKWDHMFGDGKGWRCGVYVLPGRMCDELRTEVEGVQRASSDY